GLILRYLGFARRDRRFRGFRRFWLNQLQHTFDQRKVLARRFGKARPRDLQRLLEILPVEPGQRPRTLDESVFPQPRCLDVERALQPRVDRLYPETGDGPLSADPKDVAMQGHRYSVSPAHNARP